jgi:hypothetical protein
MARLDPPAKIGPSSEGHAFFLHYCPSSTI